MRSIYSGEVRSTRYISMSLSDIHVITIHRSQKLSPSLFGMRVYNFNRPPSQPVFSSRGLFQNGQSP